MNKIGTDRNLIMYTVKIEKKKDIKEGEEESLQSLLPGLIDSTKASLHSN